MPTRWRPKVQTHWANQPPGLSSLNFFFDKSELKRLRHHAGQGNTSPRVCGNRFWLARSVMGRFIPGEHSEFKAGKPAKRADSGVDVRLKLGWTLGVRFPGLGSDLECRQGTLIGTSEFVVEVGTSDDFSIGNRKSFLEDYFHVFGHDVRYSVPNSWTGRFIATATAQMVRPTEQIGHRESPS